MALFPAVEGGLQSEWIRHPNGPVPLPVGSTLTNGPESLKEKHFRIIKSISCFSPTGMMEILKHIKWNEISSSLNVAKRSMKGEIGLSRSKQPWLNRRAGINPCISCSSVSRIATLEGNEGKDAAKLPPLLRLCLKMPGMQVTGVQIQQMERQIASYASLTLNALVQVMGADALLTLK